MMTPSKTGKVLLTRPEPDNDSLKTLLTNQGFDVRELPLLQIEQLPESPEIRTLAMNIDQFQEVICTSKHAANWLMQLLDTYWPQIPVGIRWYAMGSGSATPLIEYGLEVSLPVTGNTSEDMLQRPELQNLDQHKVLLVKGEGGRDTLAQGLTERGASVDTLELYRRTQAEYPHETLKAVFGQWQPDQIVVLSGEALDSLWSLCRKIGYALKSTRCIVPSQRVADKAKALNLNVAVAASLHDESLADMINASLNQ
ncbi:hypothetical protein BTA51_06520 [Hahella sp. CCB-MM4]|uniref:uroporphyrinogen-III synthase n=1 Tax=Hahella sp. (strain CCB-MM4) TaxID=1926491 RepID=UPI000B9A82F6|nr:uroporphyrinogen-III synthase [Hahella sp. CCB-MM4]OZG74638.1 hypothetical protein BTA51_06520 [Hahella sp. CCB-MM4]